MARDGFPAGASSFPRSRTPIWKRDWVVYAKRPFAGPEQVLKYVARYTHCIAVSNNRLLDIDNAKVQFFAGKIIAMATIKSRPLIPAICTFAFYLWQMEATGIRIRRGFAGAVDSRPAEALADAEQARGMTIIARPYLVATTDQTSPPLSLTRRR